MTEFRRSRVYAEGWNMARKSSQDVISDAKSMARLNPYRTEPERARWNDGYCAAIA